MLRKLLDAVLSSGKLEQCHVTSWMMGNTMMLDWLEQIIPPAFTAVCDPATGVIYLSGRADRGSALTKFVLAHELAHCGIPAMMSKLGITPNSKNVRTYSIVANAIGVVAIGFEEIRADLVATINTEEPIGVVDLLKFLSVISTTDKGRATALLAMQLWKRFGHGTKK